VASLAAIQATLQLAKARLERPRDPSETADAIATQIRAAARLCGQLAAIQKADTPAGGRTLFTLDLAQAERLRLQASAKAADGYRDAALNKPAKAEELIVRQTGREGKAEWSPRHS
jgi:hypothetical protein